MVDEKRRWDQVVEDVRRKVEFVDVLYTVCTEIQRESGLPMREALRVMLSPSSLGAPVGYEPTMSTAEVAEVLHQMGRARGDGPHGGPSEQVNERQEERTTEAVHAPGCGLDSNHGGACRPTPSNERVVSAPRSEVESEALFTRPEFVECPACADKPSNAPLCRECLERRALYERIRTEIPKPLTQLPPPQSELLDVEWNAALEAVLAPLRDRLSLAERYARADLPVFRQSWAEEEDRLKREIRRVEALKRTT